ncbi:MAG: DUF4079 domain-containing protein [Leptolyngbyaceae bacterium]|nr:DUF4079 domain-containing protein [Leptolyngbyaceae bacterium]
MDLPSFLWLWRIAAWSMGLSMTLYVFLALTGGRLFWERRQMGDRTPWLRVLHYSMGACLVTLVLVLLGIGLVGTIGEYGSLGHSIHLPAGLAVVGLTLASAWSASRISVERSWARSLHIALNMVLFLGFLSAGLTGWSVVQKYLP